MPEDCACQRPDCRPVATPTAPPLRCGEYVPGAPACTRSPHPDPWHTDAAGNQWAGPDADPYDGEHPAARGAPTRPSPLDCLARAA